MPTSPDCSPNNKLCGQRCIPKAYECHQGEEGASATIRGSVAIKDLPRNEDGTVTYRGENWKINEPKPSSRKHKKMKVLAKKGDRVKVVHFGHSDYQHNYSKQAKKNYLTRASGIRNKQGELTKDDPWSPNYWSIRVLWPKSKPADGGAYHKGSRIDAAPSYAFIQGMRSVRG